MKISEIRGGLKIRKPSLFFSKYLELTDSPARTILKKYEYNVISLNKKMLKGPIIIDLGCGDGVFSEAAFEGFQIAGIDISKNAVKYAKKREVYRSIILADARFLPFRSNSVDTIISISVLEHIPKIDEVFNDVLRVLHKSGVFLFTVPAKTYNNSFFVSKILEPLSKIKHVKRLRERYIMGGQLFLNLIML